MGGEGFDQKQFIVTHQGLKASRCSSFIGSSNVHMPGKTIVHDDVIIRADLERIFVGRHCVIGARTILRPASKRFKDGLQFIPLQINDNVYIGEDCIIEAAAIGKNVYIGDGCIISKRCILKDCCRVEAGSVLPPDSIVPPFCVFAGVPATRQCYVEMPPSTPIVHEANMVELVNSFVSDTQKPNLQDTGTKQ